MSKQQWKREQREQLDELLPKATGGTREAQVRQGKNCVLAGYGCAARAEKSYISSDSIPSKSYF